MGLEGTYGARSGGNFFGKGKTKKKKGPKRRPAVKKTSKRARVEGGLFLGLSAKPGRLEKGGRGEKKQDQYRVRKRS